MTQKITELSTRDFMGTKRISIQPHGSLVVLAGANGQGKSSFIRAFEEMLDPKGTRLTPKPIRDGAEEAVVELITDTVRAVRTYRKNDAGKLEVFALDGAKYPSGKEFLAAATGGALFDPFEFVRLPEKAQRDQLLARVELPFDLDELDRKRAVVFDDRTVVNRDLKSLEGALASRVKPNPETPTEEVSAADIIAEFEKARAHNAALDEQMRDLERKQSGYETADANVAQLEMDLSVARQHAAESHKAYDALLAKMQAGPDRIDTDVISARLAAVEQTNAAIRAANEYRKVAADVERVRAGSEALTKQLEAIDKQKADGLAAAKFPVDGLSVDESGITFEGIPFRQVNTAMQTAIAFNLATLPQPDLRLVVIKDGDSLDADSLAEIERIADERGYIVLVERDRDESREIGFTITEGVLA